MHGATHARAALVAHALHELIGGDWSVERAENGWTDRSFVATAGSRHVFVKLDVRFDLLRRLAEIGVAPALLHAGQHEGEWIAVQELVEGPTPERAWFPSHLPELARLINAYHRDPLLTGMLTPQGGFTYADVVARTLSDLERRAGAGPDDPIPADALLSAVSALRARAGGLEETRLVPTHGDPSRRNFILSGGRAHIVDWDEVALADPLRDIGQILWWYVPRERWPEFFELCGLELEAGALDRLYWWIASEFLEVALTTAEAGFRTDAEAFFADFTAALHHRPNPR